MPRNVLIATLLLLVTGLAQADPQLVRVGGYQFAPFVEIAPNGQATGLTLDLIAALNDFQDDYEFVFVPSKPTQRYKEFEANRFDMVMFESKQWGWEDLPVDNTAPYLSGGERYIARAEPGRDQSYFNNLADKRLAGIKGYHYRFANFNADPDYLHRHFTINLIDSNAGSIRMVLSGRADVAVVTQSFLFRQLQRNPKLKQQLLISDEFDQHYQHTVLVRQGTKPTAQEVEQLLNDMRAQGALTKLWSRYGLELQSSTANDDSESNTVSAPNL